MLRTLTALLASVALTSVGCASGGSQDDGWTTSETRTTLTLTASSPEHIAGQFTRAGITVSFDAYAANGTHTLMLRAADGRVLVSTAGIADTRVVTVLDRLTVSPRILDVGAPDALHTVGDESALGDVLESSEAQILPWLSRTLGERGFTGVSHPASLDIHTFSQLVARAQDIEVPAIDPVAIPGNEERAAQSSCNRATANGCYGMCGKGCGCWSWVCGDCCYHRGCAAHDSDCRKCSKSNPMACARCASFASFWSGGGC